MSSSDQKDYVFTKVQPTDSTAQQEDSTSLEITQTESYNTLLGQAKGLCALLTRDFAVRELFLNGQKVPMALIREHFSEQDPMIIWPSEEKKRIEAWLAHVRARKRAYKDEAGQPELSPDRWEASREEGKVLMGEKEGLRAALQGMVDRCYVKLREIEHKLFTIKKGKVERLSKANE